MERNRLLGIAASAVIVAFGVYWAIARPLRLYNMPTASMAPTAPKGSRVVVRTTKNVRVGDIVVFRYPPHPSTTYAKRIVAAGGDNVEIRDKHLIVNGREVNEPYVVYEDETVYPNQPALPEPFRSRDQFGPYRVPAGSYFVLGDNRDQSADSRYWGVVPPANVIGRVIYVFK